MNSNIKAFVPKSSEFKRSFGNCIYYHLLAELTAYNNQSGIFASDKMEEKFRVNINTCKTSTMLFLLKISMEKDDFVQTNRVRYEGTTCHPRFFQSSRSVLFGMKKAANSKSKYTVAYFCPDSNMYGNTIALLTCEKVRNYVMNKSIFNSLLEYITANVQSAYKMLLTPKYQLCKIFKTAQEGCNIYSFANTTLCQ
jgi:hypothetical protein